MVEKKIEWQWVDEPNKKERRIERHLVLLVQAYVTTHMTKVWSQLESHFIVLSSKKKVKRKKVVAPIEYEDHTWQPYAQCIRFSGKLLLH